MVVGFDINRPQWTQELEAIAEAANGTYLQVAEAEDLSAQVVAAVTLSPPEFQVVNADDQPVAHETFGASVTLDPGEYTLKFEHLGESITTGFWIHPTRTTRVHFDPATDR